MITVNEVEIKPTIFPDKTSQVWKLSDELLKDGFFNINWQFEHESELIHISQLKLLLDQYGKSQIFIPYLPYARQDKPVMNGSTFSLYSFAELINAMKFETVYCFDPHSEISGILIENFCAVNPFFEIINVLKEVSAEVVCYPDKGATKKYSEIIDFPFIFGEKTRNQETGIITQYKVESCNYKKVLIVDDICDGGMTFILLAEELKRHGVEDINMYVSHGLFTKGTDCLYQAGIKRIFTRNGEVK